MVPMVISENTQEKVLPASHFELIERVEVYFAENVRTARRFLRSCGIKREIESIEFQELNKRTSHADIQRFFEKHKGKEIGVMSESGCPGVADPGAEVVKYAQQQGITVVPHVGPSSILMALMGSGFNGQKFSFQGYLPIDKKDCEKAIRSFEQRSAKSGEAILFIETPYRNQRLKDILLNSLSVGTRLLVAVDISGESQSIKTRTVKQWKSEGLILEKLPTIFGLQAT